MSLSNNDYQDIMRQYEKDGLITVSMSSARKIYTQTIPEIKELDRQITANFISSWLIIRDDPVLRGADA